MSEDPFGGWGTELPVPGRAQAIAALGVSHARWSQDGGTGAPDLQQLQAALQAVVDAAGPEGAPMVQWELAGDLGFLTGVPAAAMAQLWWEHAPRLRRRVRPEDPKPLRLEVALSPATEPFAAWLSAQLVGSANWAVGVHLREDRLTSAPRWHWPLRVRCLDDSVSQGLATALRDSWPCAMNLADVLLPGDASRPAELLLLPWSLTESVAHLAAAKLQAPVAGVVVLGGGQDLPWPELRARKDEILGSTGAAGLYITDLDQAQAAAWFNELGFNLDHNYQLDVAITSAWYGGFGPLKGLLDTAPTSAGVLFAAPELLEVSQLANQVTAIADGFAALPGNPILDVPPGLHIPPGRLPAQELAQQIRVQAQAFGYEHESSEATAAAGAGRALDEVEARAASELARAGFTHAMPPSRPPHRAYGLLDCPAEVVVGELVEVEVGLSAEQARGVAGARMLLPPLPGPDEDPYEVVVRIAATGFSFGPGNKSRHSLQVSAATPYPTVKVGLVPNAVTGPTECRISADFYVGGGRVGDAIRAVTVVTTDAERTRPKDERSSAGIGSVGPTGARIADLTITIRRTEKPDVFAWTVESPHPEALPEDAPREYPIPPDRNGNLAGSKDFLAGLLAAIGKKEGEQGGHPFNEVLGAAKRVRDAIPNEVYHAIRAIATKTGQPPSILLYSEEPYMPWELAWLSSPLVPGSPDPGAPPPPPPFLGAQARVGRWVQGVEPSDGPTQPQPAPQEKAVHAVSVVCGDYSGISYPDLPHATAEAEEFVKLYGATQINPTGDTMSEFLNNKPPAPDLIHFAVHGQWSDTGAEDDGIILTDGNVLLRDEVHGATLTAAPLVFLNACQVGAGHAVLGRYSGIAAEFVYAGASCVIAPIWAIDDAVASSVAETFYREIAKGERPCEVLRKSRLDFDLASTSATAMGYQFFGHPDLVVTGLPTGS